MNNNNNNNMKFHIVQAVSMIWEHAPCGIVLYYLAEDAWMVEYSLLKDSGCLIASFDSHNEATDKMESLKNHGHIFKTNDSTSQMMVVQTDELATMKDSLDVMVKL
jgi:hypothetical protein